MMDDTDKRLLNEIQSHFPITERPYLEVATRLGLRESEVVDRVKRLKEAGIIRRIGGNFHSHKLDFISTLCAARVPGDKVEEFVEAVNRHPGVTHNYLRNHDYNIWFTFIAENMETVDRALEEIAQETGVADILNLPALKMFKIKVDFEV